MFAKILVANRGAIATRIIGTIRRMGIRSVAVYHELDAHSLHVSQADEAYSLGVGRAADTYLNQKKLFAIARQSGANAVHPGYGFLSENAEFVRRCDSEGITFIGPTADQLVTFGLKHRARELALQNNVPMLPGSGLLETPEQAIKAAAVIGFPVMLKSTAGGGGIGMQMCRSDIELDKAFASVRRLSENNFANNGVFIEKYIQRARHIEVQVFGDGHSEVITLGERDCSTQRRNQKVIEEAPAPNLSPAVRAELFDAARRLMAAVAYRNAGTVEFVYDQACDKFYFLEVNTRLQVEHGVTEEVYGIDLVEWMIRLAAGELSSLANLGASFQPSGHAIQARVYAEDASKDFQPCAGLLSKVSLPALPGVRINHWISTGLEVPSLFDPMLAKVIAKGHDRAAALTLLDDALSKIEIYGIETNIAYVRQVLNTPIFTQGRIYTRYLNELEYTARTLDVTGGGTMTTIQDYPGRVGFWSVGVPPSGPMDSYSFRLGNRLLNNPEESAGLEVTLNGPTLRFNCAAKIVLAGAAMQATLDDTSLAFWSVVQVEKGQVLRIGKTMGAGARAYLLVQGGIQCPAYLGSRATFTLGQFGGHSGRALRSGDVLHVGAPVAEAARPVDAHAFLPIIENHWDLRVIYGPHGAPDFFTENDIETFFASEWEVHYNSSRTGIRLVGPKPQWARSDGGEAGMHPSNIHDNAYAIGSIDFTGDMPVILGPDGPSLGGFVCPATVVQADLWKLGQLKAGDKIRFISIDIEGAARLERSQILALKDLRLSDADIRPVRAASPILKTLDATESSPGVVYRPAGDKYLLVEYGPLTLDVELRFRVHALMLWVQAKNIPAILDITPGIRSLQIHYESLDLPLPALLELLGEAEQELDKVDEMDLPSRVVYLPLSWDDEACRLAISKYMQSVRKDAPWCPSNIEFIRRINGLNDIEQIREIVFNANYLVMGLGDVYLGAPVATPIDPRHRLVTTKYNPARTWTAENSVGIGGSYLCVYGMEGPGGYQFIGRTIQMWNRYHSTSEFTEPWLLRFFDQIRFYEVSAAELERARRVFPRGQYPIKIEQTRFSLKSYREFLAKNRESIEAFTHKRQQAFDAELHRWISSGQINFESEQSAVSQDYSDECLPDHCVTVESPVAGSVWQVLVKPGDGVVASQPLAILESMKMEIEITASHAGTVYAVVRSEGAHVSAGQALLILRLEP